MISGDLPHKIKTIHEEYGDVVRIGPDELSFTNPVAWRDIYPKNFIRPSQYKDKPPGKDAENLITASEPDHARFRKVLAPAFSERSVQEQEPLVQKHIDKLIHKLYREITGDGLNNAAGVEVVSWFNYTAFDITSDLVWGTPFGCLDEVRYHPWIEAISQFKVAIIIGSIKFYPPLGFILNAITPKSALEPVMRMWKVTEDYIAQRLESKTPYPDVMSHIIAANAIPSGPHMSREELEINSMMVVMAGSEAVTTLLTGTVNHLLHEQDKLQKLTSEVRSSFKSKDEITGSAVNHLPYLNAVIHEGMRISPSLADGLRREIPRGGASVAGHFLPERTVVSIPQWATYHSPDNFSSPTSFSPERWLSKSFDTSSPFSKDRKDAFQPFSLGPHNCPGRNLGYLELRLILANIVWNFDLAIPEGTNLPEWGKQKIYWFWDKQPTYVKLSSAKRA